MSTRGVSHSSTVPRSMTNTRSLSMIVSSLQERVLQLLRTQETMMRSRLTYDQQRKEKRQVQK